MNKLQSLPDLKAKLQAGLEGNDEVTETYGEPTTTQLKAYLIEVNDNSPNYFGCPQGSWRSLGENQWYTNQDIKYNETLFLDTSRTRVWILYSILDTGRSDLLVREWVGGGKKIDRCWLSRNQLMHWGRVNPSWKHKGIGLKFSDGLSPEENAAKFSLKAWYSDKHPIEGLEEILDKAKKNFAIYSVRWQKRVNSSVDISSEIYSNGKITVNRANDINDVMIWVSELANTYTKALNDATDLRNSTMAAFELNFSQEIDLDSFSKNVLKGSGDMRLWLIETEKDSDFRRYKGIDLHTWDRVFIDLGPDYAYLTIPTDGCVNAAPRIATLQGEDIGGYTQIYHDGVEVFA